MSRTKLTTEIFIKRSIDKYGYTYDYSKTEYKTAKTKVIIICRVEGHGEFLQSPDKHMRGSGCKKCTIIKTTNSRRKTNEEFIKDAKRVHGDKYDYSPCDYKDGRKAVTITCKIHGEFKQKPCDHLQGNGCQECGKIKMKESAQGRIPPNSTRTQEDFILKAEEVHGDTYDYSKVEYINSKEKIIIICKEHGEFLQLPSVHLGGSGCNECGRVRTTILQRKSRADFIEEAEEVHGDTYDYSKVEYINSKEKIIIICKVHGEFSQFPYSHSKGAGCPKCAGNVELTPQEFFSRISEIHENKYDYSKTVFNGRKEKLEIICRIHGSFLQTASDHLAGKGCTPCGIEKRASAQRLTKEEFINKSITVHGDRYDYSKFEYKNANTKGIIICTVDGHGEFPQTSGSHMAGHGCPKCIQSHGEEKISLFMTKNKIPFKTQVSFDDCKDKSLLYFDNQVELYDLLTEFDGKQHFEDGGFFNKRNECLETRNKRDMIKNNYVYERKINFIRISYSQIAKIDNILTSVIKRLKESPNKRIFEFYGIEYLNILKYYPNKVYCYLK